jgi:peptide/nickel transport system substrate-binding protein
MISSLYRSICAGMLVAAVCATGVSARDLTIGRVAEHSSMDPQFNNAGNDTPIRKFVFDSLVDFDANQNVVPTLALSWKALNPRQWEVTLRSGVVFHDGSPFTADDVAFSLARIDNIPNSPSSYIRTRGELQVEVLGPLTLRLTSPSPNPFLIENVGQIPIVSRKAAEGASSSDFNTGAAAIGTGPYRFVSWARGDNVKFARFDRYWGGAPEFDTVTVRFIPSAAARVAALLSGGLDLIDGVPNADTPRIAQAPGLRVWSVPTARITYLALDQGRDDSPFLTDIAGQKLARNPLRDQRVRLALSKLIDRKALSERLLNGGGTPASQLSPPPQPGYNPDIQVTALDIAGARSLLAEAGYPNGFGMTIHASNDRFPQDAAVAQTLGQMFTRGGIKVNDVATMPFNVFSTQATQLKFSVFLYAYNSALPGASDYLRAMVGSFDAVRGLGGVNRGRYSNPALDQLIAAADAEFDAGRRDALHRQAMAVAMADVAVVPIYAQTSYWASKADIVFQPSVGDETQIRFIHIAK